MTFDLHSKLKLSLTHPAVDFFLWLKCYRHSMTGKVIMIMISLLLVAPLIAVANEAPVNMITTGGAETSRPWWLGGLITIFSTVFGTAFGALIVVYQLGRQHRNELDLQRENHRERLRLEIYQEFASALDESEDAGSEVGVYVFTIPGLFKSFCDRLQDGLNPPPVTVRANDFFRKHHDAYSAVVQLIRLIEKYEIVEPKLNIFKTAMNTAIHDMRCTALPLFSCLLQICPNEHTTSTNSTNIVNVVRPTNGQLDGLKGLVDSYTKARDDLEGYLYDFNVELQNIFLGKLFSNEVQRREPLDPNAKVVTIESGDMENLRRYFEEETDWGRSIHRMKDTCRQSQ